MRRFEIRIIACGCLLAAALLVGCGGKGEPSAAAGDGPLKTGPGVTADRIRLGVFTDLSGVFAALGQPLLQGTRLYWDRRNGAGGVCGRRVELVVKDHGYDPQKAVVQYRDLRRDVAGLQQLFGSPVAAALVPSLKTDSMLSVLVSSASSLLPNDFVLEPSASYDVETINGLDQLLADQKIARGDKIGQVYFEGEYGENALTGARAFAKRTGMTVVPQEIAPTDEDMAGQVAALASAGVKAIVVSAGPAQLASVAGLAAARHLDVPIVGNSATWTPALLTTPAGPALKRNAYLLGSSAPYAAGGPGVREAADAYEAADPKAKGEAPVLLGWAFGEVMDRTLRAACDAGDLSRAGIVEAARSLSRVDLRGLTAGPLDFTRLGEPATRRIYISRPADVPGGLRPLGTFESDGAREYQVAPG